ncbi:HAD hydrolase family protein [Gillisia sp. M10.2A]|uniref:3-deoxy-D-manno-octulosonate 8-phosphate phosphatase KdsC n=1 Tax=Gillisia lutea TaxID=2909668 RepID=A0ABS9EIH8_9FLAO|nr:HAD hydrolase family protein [Gillisia lutea]MCF4102668.1 HAD hydrolase family protein [Gillisia lutea]
MRIKLLVSDIDGVWTDGSFYYSEKGDALRKFSTKDSFGVSLANIMDLPILILSGEQNEMVISRLKKLNITNYQLGVKNKLNALLDFCTLYAISLSEVAYIGDDMNDHALLNKVGLFVCPVDANLRIKQNAHVTLEKKGGEGAFREFVEYVLEKEGVLEVAYDRYIKIND